jgi:tetratricopeptide (TPR) repeat protein
MKSAVNSLDHNDNNHDDKTRTHHALSKGTMVSHYRIVEKIGAGGMGEVYLADDTDLDRKVALKFLPHHMCADEDCRARFKREAQAAAGLKHSNIVTIYEVSEYNGQPFFSMERCEGQPLHDVIREQTLSIEQIINLVLQIGEGLQEAHDAGIIHRDIKPSNIVFDKKGRPKLADFGLALIKGDDKLTKTGSTLGTIGYMSPEQIQVKDVDHRADLFSLGVVLYEMIAGQLPFKGDNEASILNAVLNEIPEPLSRYKSNVPDELQRIVSKLLEKDPGLRYQSAAGIISDLKLLRRDSGPVALRSERPFERTRRLLVPVFMVAIAVLLFVLKPWKVEIQPTDVAIAAENRLAIMYFDNLADLDDTQKLGEIAATLLITDLTESQYVNVVSSQRLYDILKLLGKEGEKKIGRDVATEVAKKAGSRWMLLGSILQVDPQLIITSQLVEVATGNAIASQRINGNKGESIFALIDKLTMEIKNDLSLPEGALSEADQPVANVTTHSPEAYRFYLEGWELNLRFYGADAEAKYLEALEFDSTFAMVYYRLSALKSGAKRKQYATLALKYAEKANWEEQSIIKAWYARITGHYEEAIRLAKTILDRDPMNLQAWEAIGLMYDNDVQNMQEAIFHYQKVIEIDSSYAPVYNQLAYVYNNANDFEKAIWAINKYISLTPDDANPYDSRGEIYACNGKLDEAIESFKKAVEIKSDFYNSWETMGHMYLFKGQYDRARECFEIQLGSAKRGTRSTGRANLALIPLFQGKFEEALALLNQGIAADEMEGVKAWTKYYAKCRILVDYGDIEKGLIELQHAIDNWAAFLPDIPVPFYNYKVQLLATQGDYDSASQVLLDWKQDIDEKEWPYADFYFTGLGGMEFGKGNFDAAVKHFSDAEKSVPNRLHPGYFNVHIMLARSYMEAGKLGEAVTEFEKLLSNYSSGRAEWSTSSVKLHYYLGVLYEKSSWDSKAIEQYETFLEIWKDADPGMESVEDAKTRLARLQNKT